MRMYPAGLLLTILFLCTGSFAFSQGNYPKTLLWRISGKDLQKPSYLFGTMHLKDARIFQFSDSLYHFLEQAEGYAMEIDPERAMELMLNSLSEPDTSVLLKEIMDKEEFKKAAKNIEKQFGIAADKVTRKQAWLFKFGLGYGDTEKPDDMDAPVDTYLYNIARRQGKWVGGIEDVEDQFNILDELFSADDFINNKKNDKAGIEKLIKLYIAQDLNSIEKMMSNYDSEQKDIVLTRRNIKMSRRIDSLAHIRSHFFAIGAAHLPGKEGVIQLLKDLGYHVSPVSSNKKVNAAQYRYTPIDLPWTSVKNEEETFSVLMPGKAVNFKPYGDIMKMKMYVDLGTGIVYSASSMHIPGNKNKESVLLRLAANYAKTDKIIKQENITENNRKGVALLTSNNGYYCQLKFFSEGDQLIMMMVGSQKKAQLDYSDVTKFFGSLNINAKAPSNEWYRHEDKSRAYAISFPGKPASYSQLNEQVTQKEGADAWNVSNLSYVDPVSQAFYTLVIKETKPGYFIQSDEQMFEEAKAGFENNPNIKLVKYKTGSVDNKYACFWMDGIEKVNNLSIKSYHVSRGNRNLSLMVVYSPALTDSTQIQQYFQSFNLLDYETSVWGKQSDSLQSFSTWAPSAFTTYFTDSSTKSSQSFAFDNNTGLSFYVEKQTYPQYYWAKNDSVLYSNFIHGMVTYEDSILYEKNITVDGLRAREFSIQLKQEARNLRHGLVVLNGDTLYTVYTIIPKAEMSGGITQFMSSFKFAKQYPATSLFTNKASKLFNDLNAVDSITFSKASNAFDYVTLEKPELPLLHEALLRQYQDFDPNLYCLHDRIVDKVLFLADSTTVAFIDKHYTQVESEELKYPLLNILAGIKTNESYNLLKSLLKDQRPVKGNVSGLGNKLSDSLLLSKSLIPDLLPLFSDTLFANTLPRVVNELLDSNMLLLSALEPFHAAIIAECKRLSILYEKSDGNTSWSIREWIRLVGKINAKESMPLIKQIARSSDTYVQYQAVLTLLANNQTIDPLVLAKLASDQYYRADLYAALKERSKTSLFPVKYATQQSIAQSLLASYASDDYEPQSINFITTKQTTFKGKPATFYLYKVVFALDDESTETYLGVVGPFDNKGIKTEVDLIGLSSELFDAKSVNKQFSTLLEESSEE